MFKRDSSRGKDTRFLSCMLSFSPPSRQQKPHVIQSDKAASKETAFQAELEESRTKIDLNRQEIAVRREETAMARKDAEMRQYRQRDARSSHPSRHRSISPRRENNRLANSSYGHSGQRDYEASDDMAIAIDRSHENEVSMT